MRPCSLGMFALTFATALLLFLLQYGQGTNARLLLRGAYR